MRVRTCTSALTTALTPTLTLPALPRRRRGIRRRPVAPGAGRALRQPGTSQRGHQPDTGDGMLPRAAAPLSWPPSWALGYCDVVTTVGSLRSLVARRLFSRPPSFLPLPRSTPAHLLPCACSRSRPAGRLPHSTPAASSMSAARPAHSWPPRASPPPRA